MMKASLTKRFLTVVLTCCLATASTVGGVNVSKGEAEDDAKSVIAAYRADDPNARVRLWQSEITHPGHNPKYKEFLAERLREWERTEFAPHRLNDPQIVARLREVISPVLRLYNRQDCFEIIIIDHPAPVAMNDSGVILMFSTGMLERAASDDDLLGHAAHEVGHDLHWRRTAQARRILELQRTGGVGTDLTERQALEELTKIELECDAFSAVTLAALGKNPLPSARLLEAVEREYPDYVRPDLPPAALRAKVIEGVVPADACRVTPQMTTAFKKLKALLAARP